ncbi:MAG TPA: hypothetical protein PLX54_08065 [Candidatus Fermentibacter daniensis]|nr:hypothetical protein [Candidatus Fermentibacter daniensis]HOR07102.1 hypothetical protein [Candidatus Fermentibacter daniensis]HPK52310.1 hypothetical protein [Candidatus Fermentibacter daniensis]
MKYILSLSGQEAKCTAAEVLALYDKSSISESTKIRVEGEPTDSMIPLASSNLFKHFDHMRTLSDGQRANYSPSMPQAHIQYPGISSAGALRATCMFSLIAGVILGFLVAFNGSSSRDIQIACGIALSVTSLMSVALMFTIASIAENIASIRRQLEQH